VGRIRSYSFNSSSLQIRGNLVTYKSNLTQQQWRNIRVGWIKKWRNEKSRAVWSLLMDVVNNLRKPLLPKETRDSSCFLQIQHEPIAIVIVTSVVMVQLRRFLTFGWRPKSLAIPVGNYVDAVGICR